MDIDRRGCIKDLYSIHLCTVLYMQVLASLIRELTVMEQTACLHLGNAAILIVHIDKNFATAIANSLDI
jgi:hypothetical protein